MLTRATTTPGHHRRCRLVPPCPTREIPDAAAAEGSQRMLAQVNARIEAQRRAGGGVLGSRGNENLAARGIGQSQIRNLAEKHGIVVKFVDDGAASGVAQVRALAQAHGIRIRILGHDSGGGGGGPLDGEDGEAPVGGDGADKAATPPPILSSLRTRAAPARRSPSPVPETLKKVHDYRTTLCLNRLCIYVRTTLYGSVLARFCSRACWTSVR